MAARSLKDLLSREEEVFLCLLYIYIGVDGCTLFSPSRNSLHDILDHRYEYSAIQFF